MTTETKRLIRVRTEKGAVFKRDGFGKKRQLSDSWRKPRGQHNKQREQRKAKGNLPKPGFGSPVAVRGMHPSGFFEVLVFMEKDLEKLDAKTQAIRISAGVGARKRKGLQEKAAASGFKILNAHMIKEPVREEAPAEPEVEAAKDKKEKKTKEARKEAPAKKSTSRAEGAKKKGAEEKKPVKTSTSKSKPAAKETAKKEEKAAKPKAKEAAKTPAKKSAPLKAEKKPVAAEEKPKAEKAKAKKKSSSEVKKND
jgi:large subunit ribosomal protein L32e